RRLARLSWSTPLVTGTRMRACSRVSAASASSMTTPSSPADEVGPRLSSSPHLAPLAYAHLSKRRLGETKNADARGRRGRAGRIGREPDSACRCPAEAVGLLGADRQSV